MDTVPAILILIPILTPLAIARGIEPIHFGILVECNVGGYPSARPNRAGAPWFAFWSPGAPVSRRSSPAI
jgi:hypothetical protein